MTAVPTTNMTIPSLTWKESVSLILGVAFWALVLTGILGVTP